jgi:hypothetical protein
MGRASTSAERTTAHCSLSREAALSDVLDWLLLAGGSSSMPSAEHDRSRRNGRAVRHQLASEVWSSAASCAKDVLAGDITLSARLWKRPQVKGGGRYRVGPGLIEVDAIELLCLRRSPTRTSGERASPTARSCATALRTRGRSTRTPSFTGSGSIRCARRLSWGVCLDDSQITLRCRGQTAMAT